MPDRDDEVEFVLIQERDKHENWGGKQNIGDGINLEENKHLPEVARVDLVENTKEMRLSGK